MVCVLLRAPVQVARLLVNMHNQVAAGDFSYVNEMKSQAAAAASSQAAAASQRAPNGLPDADESSSDEDDAEEGSQGSAEAMDAEVRVLLTLV
jgi:ribosomal protein L12E/L44/L45/RPP1/RPP2